MKAIRIHEFGEADVLKYEDVPDPAAGPGQVLVKVEAIGINPVETYIRSGIHLIRPVLPFILGSDAAGTVLAVGKIPGRVCRHFPEGFAVAFLKEQEPGALEHLLFAR